MEAEARYSAKTYTFFVGTYSPADKPGIHTCELDTTTGKMTLIDRQDGILNPSFLEIDKAHQRLLAVSEAIDSEGDLVSYGFGGETGGLSHQSTASTKGSAPCYVQIDESGAFAVVSNYAGGNVALFSVAEDGQLQLLQSIQHHGHSVNQNRQESPHPHSAVIGPTGEYVYVQDLGIDQIVIYRLNKMDKQLTYHNAVSIRPGSGPRHLVFHPVNPYVYLINELDSTITAFTWNETDGGLTEIETISALPSGFEGESWAADIHISPDGSYLYASNRGHNGIAVFAIDGASGHLSNQGFVSTQGDYPRNFALTPDGEILIVANQLSHNIVTYFIDQQTGVPHPTGQVIEVKSPVCIRVLQP